MTYAELLRDPRWQRKRLEVMERAGFACEQCGDTGTTLNVHHARYVRGRMPWEYGEADLHCLCERCHAKSHGIPQSAPRKKRVMSVEETALRARMSDADRRLVEANADEKESIILEKRDLAIQLTEFTKHLWVG